MLWPRRVPRSDRTLLVPAPAGGDARSDRRIASVTRRADVATMTKADIIEKVYDSLDGFSKKDSAEIVEMVFEAIKETLEQGEKIKISGFGNFVVRQKKERTGRNPQTGEEIRIAPRKVLTFKPSQVLKNAINT
jgi:integration host factor subunit alpha